MRRRPATLPSIRGLTLVELMVSLAIGLVVVLAATALLLSSRSAYLGQDDETQLQEGGRYALELIGRAVRQAGYENWDQEESPILATEGMTPNIYGLDAHRLSANTAGLEGASNATNQVVHGSDVLAVRFFGSGRPDADGSMLDCAGFPVAAPESQEDAEDARGWSLFYVAVSNGTPALYCKYRGWSAQPIVQGVESFQVLYGVDFDDDGRADRYLRATDVSAQSAWKQVVMVRIGLLLRGRSNTRADAGAQEYHLFGPEYSESFGAVDPGVRIRESDLPAGERARRRVVFSASYQLRNRARGSQ